MQKMSGQTQLVESIKIDNVPNHLRCLKIPIILFISSRRTVYLFLNTKVSQGNVEMRLRYGRIFNDQFVTRALLSLTVKNLKNGQHLPKLRAKIVSWYFLTHLVCSTHTFGFCLTGVILWRLLHIRPVHPSVFQRKPLEITGVKLLKQTCFVSLHVT